jgi:hypothetical protein
VGIECSTKKNWLVVSSPLKNISQIGSSSQLFGKIKNVPNHQPEHAYTVPEESPLLCGVNPLFSHRYSPNEVLVLQRLDYMMGAHRNIMGHNILV